MTKKALITGISVFTGRYMRASLENAGYKVYGNSLTPNEDPNVFLVDICDLALVREMVEATKPDLVVHMAGVSHVAHDNFAQLHTTNILGSRNLLQALFECKSPVQSIMMVSSANVYGNSSCGPLTEESPVVPTSDYSVSKLALENFCSLWANKLPIFIVRPFNYTGVGQSDNFLIPKIINSYAQKARTISLGNLDVYREFNDVRRVVEIYTRLFQVNPTGRTINICSGKINNLDEIINIMNDIAGYEIEVEMDRRVVRENEIKSLSGSNLLLQKLVGSVEFGPIEDTLRWMYSEAVN